MSGDKAVLRNDEGAPVQLGNDRFGKVGSPNYGGNKIYCGRNEKQCGKIRGSNGDCGPSGGPQCNSCSRLQAKLYNDEGVRVRLGNDKFGPPGSANYGGDKWYCGRSMFIPGTDGQCGPSGGNQCPSCTRFQKDPLGTMAMLQSKLSTAPSAPPPPQPPAAKPAAANAKLAAGAPIKATNGWSSFISYKQDDQNDGLVLLTMQQLPGGSESNWVDKFANDRSTEGMMAGVKAADVFIAVLSPKYFGSKFCCMELDHAIACKKKMCLCYNMSKHTVQSALNWVPDELKFLLKGEVLPLHEDVQFATACIQRITSAKILQVDCKAPPKPKHDGAYVKLMKEQASQSEDGVLQLTQKVKEALMIDAGKAMPIAIKEANDIMGLPNSGPLPAQVKELVKQLGL